MANSNIDDEEKHALMVFIGQRDVFATDTPELGHTQYSPLKINTDDAAPVRRRLCRVSPEQRLKIERQADDLEKHGIIRESNSLCQSSVVLVKKKQTGEYRFAVDYRGVIKVTKSLNFPITDFQDVIDSLGQSKSSIYSVLDMALGFFQISLDPETKDRTDFVTYASYVFSMIMNEVLRGISYKFALVYIYT